MLKGLQSRAVRTLLEEGSQAAVTKPAAAIGNVSDALEKRARKAGLVRETKSGFHVKSGPETVHWGYLWSAAEPVLRVKPGAIVTIDTVSHEGLLEDQGDPVPSSSASASPKSEVLADAAAIYAKVQHSAASARMWSRSPIYIEGAEPGDVLAVHVLEAVPRVPYGVNTAALRKGGLAERVHLESQHRHPLRLEDRASPASSERIEVPLAPFFGIMATGPARTLGRLNSAPPGAFGGNIDLEGPDRRHDPLSAGACARRALHVRRRPCRARRRRGDLTAIETSLTGTFRFELLKRQIVRLAARRDRDPLDRHGPA